MTKPNEASSPETRRPRRPALHVQLLGLGLGVLLVLLSVGGVLIATRPKAREYRIVQGTPEERLELAAQARAERAELLTREPNFENRLSNYWAEDALEAVAAIHEFTAREGRLPWSLTEAGIADDQVVQGMRLAVSRKEWRLISPTGRMIARGD